MNDETQKIMMPSQFLSKRLYDYRLASSDSLFDLRTQFEELQKDTILRQCFTNRIHEIDLALGALKAMIDQLEK